MREVADPPRIRTFLRELGRAATEPARAYLVGGTTAVLLGWREATTDVDLLLEPEHDALLRAMARLKDELHVNVEIAAPSHFVPEVPGWRDRSVFVADEGKLGVFHYDLVSQALAKIERGHAMDLEDVRHMLSRRLVTPEQLRDAFASIEPSLYRFPAVDPSSFRAALEQALAD